MVNLYQINKLVDGIIMNGTIPQQEFSCAFASDLMSDVLRLNKDGLVLLTGLSTMQTIRTAEVSNIYCVIIVRGKRVTNEMLKLAKENNIALISCASSMFEASGRLYNSGVKSVY